MRFRETGHFAKELREASGAGAKRMRRKRPELQPLSLTDNDIAVLRQGARHPDGVINPARKSNFDKPERRMKQLVEAGFAIPNAHGDWYITDKGRELVARNTIGDHNG